MTQDEIIGELLLDLSDLIAEAEFELDRDLTEEERQSITQEFLAGLDEDNEEENPTFFAEPPKQGGTTVKPEPVAGPGHDLAIGGPDGAQAEKLLEASIQTGANRLRAIMRQALQRAATKGQAALKTGKFFTKEELQAIADQIAATNATAELLGRSRIQERAKAVLAARGTKTFSQEVPFHVFAGSETLEPMTPERALEFFKGLIPELAIDVERWGPLLQRQAFTLAVAAEEVLVAKVQAVIADRLATGQDFKGAVKEIDSLLDEAGVSVKNPQYSEMVFRTNMADAYNSGAEAEGLDLAETFPVWKYSNPSDGRSRPHHKERNGNYYANKTGSTFSAIRGTDISEVANCRCSPIFLSKWEWQELEAQGAKIAA